MVKYSVWNTIRRLQSIQLFSGCRKLLFWRRGRLVRWYIYISLFITLLYFYNICTGLAHCSWGLISARDIIAAWVKVCCANHHNSRPVVKQVWYRDSEPESRIEFGDFFSPWLTDRKINKGGFFCQCWEFGRLITSGNGIRFESKQLHHLTGTNSYQKQIRTANTSYAVLDDLCGEKKRAKHLHFDYKPKLRRSSEMWNF